MSHAQSPPPPESTQLLPSRQPLSSPVASGTDADELAPVAVLATRTLPALEAIVIGASAGGVDALGRLLPVLPGDFGVPIVVVLHLLPDVQSELAALFGARCRMRVMEANDRQPLEAGTIYLAPPGYHLLISPEGNCSLSIDEPVNFSRPSIDVLFESASWTFGNRLLGILLTGASADGAAGLAQIRANGGTAWVQSPASAQADAMPLAAIALGAVDHVMTIEDMQQALMAAARDRAGAMKPARPDVKGGTTRPPVKDMR